MQSIAEHYWALLSIAEHFWAFSEKQPQTTSEAKFVVMPSNSIGVLLSKKAHFTREEEQSYNCKSTKSGTYFLRVQRVKVAEKALFQGFEGKFWQ